MRRTQTIFLKADARGAQTKILQDLRNAHVQRLDVRMIDRDFLTHESRNATFSAKESSTTTGSPLRGHKSMNPRTVLARSRCRASVPGKAMPAK